MICLKVTAEVWGIKNSIFCLAANFLSNTYPVLRYTDLQCTYNLAPRLFVHSKNKIVKITILLVVIDSHILNAIHSYFVLIMNNQYKFWVLSNDISYPDNLPLE